MRGERVSSGAVVNAIQAFATATNQPCEWNGDGKVGLGYANLRGTFFELTYRDPDGGLRFPLGMGQACSLYQLEQATRLARAFALTPNEFGETERLLMDSDEDRKTVLDALNEAGATIRGLAVVLGPNSVVDVSEATTLIQKAKSVLLRRSAVAEGT